MDTVSLSNLILRVRIGLGEKERSRAQRVRIDLRAATCFSRALRTGNIRDTVDYKPIRDRILRLGAKRHFVLLESLAAEILKIAIRVKGVQEVTVSAQKIDVWANGTPGVTLTRNR